MASQNEKLKKELAESKERVAALTLQLDANFDLSKVKIEKADELWHTNYELSRKSRLYEKACKEAGISLFRAEEAERKLKEIEMKMVWKEKRLIQSEKKFHELEEKLKEKEKILTETEKTLAANALDLKSRNVELSKEVKRLNHELNQMREIASISAGRAASMNILEVDSVKLSGNLGGKTQEDAKDKLLKEAIEKMWSTESCLVAARDEIHYLKQRNKELAESNAELRFSLERERREQLEVTLRNKGAVDEVISHLAKTSLQKSKRTAKTDDAVENMKNSFEEKEELQERLNLHQPDQDMSWDELLATLLPPSPPLLPPSRSVNPIDSLAPSCISSTVLTKPDTVPSKISFDTVFSSTVPDTISQDVVVLSDYSITVDDDDDIECLGEVPSSSSTFRSKKRHL